MTSSDRNFTRRKKNVPFCNLIDRVLELVEAEIELARLYPEGPHEASPLHWVLTQQALLELATALHACGAFTNARGQNPTFTALMRALGGLFNVTVNDIYMKRYKLFERSTCSTPFLDRLREAMLKLVDDYLK